MPYSIRHLTIYTSNSVFKHFDRDNSGSIDGMELSQAMTQFGYPLNPQLLDLVQRKYGKLAPSFLSPGLTYKLRLQSFCPDARWPSSRYHVRPFCPCLRCRQVFDGGIPPVRTFCPASAPLP